MSKPPPVFPLMAEWCLPDGMTSAEYGGNQPVPIPGDAGWEHITYHNLGNGCGLFDYKGLTTIPVTVKGTLLVEQPYLCLRLTTAGCTSMTFPGHEPMTASSETVGLYLMTSQTSTMQNLHGELNSVVAPILTLDRIRTMLTGQRLPADLQRCLDGRGDFNGSVRSSAILHKLAHEVRANPYKGVLSALFIEGKIFEMIAETISLISENNPSVGRTLSRDRAAAMMARDLIMADLYNPLSLESLAQQVGLTERRLNEVFREMFGAPVFRYIAQCRLNLARDLLLDGRLSVKEIAFDLGYAHVSNFTAAFTRQFGQAPATYRTAVRSAHTVLRDSA